jgi:hypothetical protein
MKPKTIERHGETCVLNEAGTCYVGKLTGRRIAVVIAQTARKAAGQSAQPAGINASPSRLN